MNITDIASNLVNGNIEGAADKLKDPTVWVAIAIAVGLLTVIMLVIRRFSRKAKEKFYSGKQATVSQVILNTIRLFVIVIFVIALMNILGINVSGVSAFIGIHILSDKFFDVGDIVLYDEIEGIVEEFTLTSTKIRTLVDGSVYSVANRNIEKIKKLSSLINLKLLVGLEEKVEIVEEVLNAACIKIAALDGIENAKYLGFDGYASSGCNYIVCVRMKNAADRLNIKRAAMRVINIELRDNNIEVPYEHVVISKKDNR